MDYSPNINALSEADAKEIVKRIFTDFCSPAFASIPKREIELLIFETMHQAKIFDQTTSIYELMTGLGITRAKASQLIF